MKNLLFALTMVFGIAISSSPVAANTQGGGGDIVDIAVATPELSTLVTALETAGLVDDLKGPGPFTVFAPTNTAFEALPDGVLEDLLANPDALAEVLLYHVAAGAKSSSKLAKLSSLTTLLGEDVTITKQKDGLYINNAKVVVADIVASNGIIHIIDAVLIP